MQQAELSLTSKLGDRRVFKDDFLMLDTARRWEVEVKGEVRQLTRIQWKLLYQLCKHAGLAVSHMALIQNLYGEVYGYEPSADCYKYHICLLRRALTQQGQSPPIETIKGFGYKYHPYFERS